MISLLWMSGVFLLIAAVAIASPVRHRRYFSDWLVILIYRWARLWYCFAVGVDKGLLHFRMVKAQTAIEPECQIGVWR
jgi:hypothetical protein